VAGESDRAVDILVDSGRNHLLFYHSIDKIEDKLALTAVGMGYTAAMEIGLTANKELKFDRLVVNFHP